MELIPLRNQVATDVWNAWHHRKVGGFISVGAPSVGTSDAVTVLRVSMHPSMRRQQGIRSLPGGWPTYRNFNSWRHHEKGCPTRRAFRRVGHRADFDPLVTGHRQGSRFCDRHGRCRSTCIATTAPATFTSSLRVVISEERCWARRRIAICFYKF